MVKVIYICLLALILATTLVNASNVDHESALREQKPSNRRQVYRRARTRRGLKKDGTSTGKMTKKEGGDMMEDYSESSDDSDDEPMDEEEEEEEEVVVEAPTGTVEAPTEAPVAAPIATAVPVTIPTSAPVAPPTAAPVAPPTAAPVSQPITVPVSSPVAMAKISQYDGTYTSSSKSGKGGKAKTKTPTSTPSARPSESPSSSPSSSPSKSPTKGPTLVPTLPPTPPPTPPPTAPEAFLSFIRLEVQTTGGATPDQAALDAAAALTLQTYNSETANCDDPFGRRMVSAEYFSMAPVASQRRMRRMRKAVRGEEDRKLQTGQNLNVFVFLKVNGECTGCPNNKFFFNPPGQADEEEEAEDEAADEGNDTTGARRRRRLHKGGRQLQADTCQTVPEGDFLDSFNAGLQNGDYGTIEQGDSIRDVEEPRPISSSKSGKGKGGKGGKRRTF